MFYEYWVQEFQIVILHFFNFLSVKFKEAITLILKTNFCKIVSQETACVIHYPKISEKGTRYGYGNSLST